MHVHNQWANEQLLGAMAGMRNEELSAVAPVSFGNLRGALWHQLGAQMGWLRVCAGFDTWSRAPVSDSQSLEGLRDGFAASHLMWREFIESLDEKAVLSPVDLPIDAPFRQSVGADLLRWSEERGHRPRRPLWQSMLHVVNHSTQHRAEVGIHLLSLGRSTADLDYGTFEENRAISE